MGCPKEQPSPFIMNLFLTWNGWSFVAATASLIAAIATSLYTYFTFHLLSASQRSISISNKLAEFEIYNRIAEKLFSDRALELLEVIWNGNFYIQGFNSEGSVETGKEKITSRELRKYLLNPIEDLAKFRDDGLITSDSIDRGFGTIILQVGNSKTVVDFIKHLRSDIYHSEFLFKGFEELYREEIRRFPGKEGRFDYFT